MNCVSAVCLVMMFSLFFSALAAPGRRRPNEYIVGGQDSSSNRWPWQAGVLSVDGFNCGGTLIDYDTVLTAAHCVHGKPLDSFTVVLGECNRDKWEGNEQYIKVSSFTVHPEYKGNFLEGRDLALLHLSHNATRTMEVRPISALADDTKMFKEANDECYITGWGISVASELSGMLSSTLQEAQIEIISNTKCNSKRFWDGMIKDTNVCALYKNIAACDGDSGGPLVCKDEDVFVLVGTTSWGSAACKNYPTVFTGVGKFRNWIYSTMYKRRGFNLSTSQNNYHSQINGELKIDCKASFVYNN